MYIAQETVVSHYRSAQEQNCDQDFTR